MLIHEVPRIHMQWTCVSDSGSGDRAHWLTGCPLVSQSAVRSACLLSFSQTEWLTHPASLSLGLRKLPGTPPAKLWSKEYFLGYLQKGCREALVWIVFPPRENPVLSFIFNLNRLIFWPSDPRERISRVQFQASASVRVEVRKTHTIRAVERNAETFVLNYLS